MKFRLGIILLAMILSIIALVGCKQEQKTENTAPTTPIVKKVKSFYPDNWETIDRMEILKSGGETKSITNPDIIKQWLDNVGELDVTIEYSPEDRNGMLYIVSLYDKEKEVLHLTPHSVNDTVIVSNRDLAEHMTQLWESEIK